jgi:hypothetical protein
LDTHRIVKRLQQAGFSDAQAETVTDVMREAREFDLTNLATKSDVATQGSGLRSEMVTLGGDLRSEMAALGSDLRLEVAALGSDLRLEMAALGSDLRSQITTLGSETKSNIVSLAKSNIVSLAKAISALRAEAAATQAANKADFSTFATKTELNLAFTVLRSEIAEGRSATAWEIAEAKADILKWVIGLVLVQGGVVVTLVKLLPGALP